MGRRFGMVDRTGRAGILAVTALLGTTPAQAPYAASCPPPLKLAAGACLAACPAGYADQGRVCLYRNSSR
ncbi:hypothetical protein FOHLNKBM_3036 [Methylobacterium longum]|nr:hypothetical protein FOHLNKBM_3036 [Methylobacterium longum]